jgi:release factor glutamine methyltransferase
MTDFLQEFIQSESERLNILHEARWIEEFVLREANDINSQKELCESVFRRRAQGEPLAYIFGSWAFREYEFFVGPGVLIPRPETEELVEYALDAIRGSALWKNLQKPTSPILRVCDLGAGTGCVGLSFAYDVLKKSPSNLQVELFLVERSPEAKEYLKKNIALFTSSYHL